MHLPTTALPGAPALLTDPAGQAIATRAFAGQPQVMPDVLKALQPAAFAGGGGASVVAARVVVTVPAGVREHSEVVTFSGCTPSMTVLASLGAHDDADENDAEMLDILAMSAQPGTGQATVELAFAEPTAGPVRVNLMAL